MGRLRMNLFFVLIFSLYFILAQADYVLEIYSDPHCQNFKEIATLPYFTETNVISGTPSNFFVVQLLNTNLVLTISSSSDLFNIKWKTKGDIADINFQAYYSEETSLYDSSYLQVGQVGTCQVQRSLNYRLVQNDGQMVREVASLKANNIFLNISDCTGNSFEVVTDQNLFPFYKCLNSRCFERFTSTFKLFPNTKLTDNNVYQLYSLKLKEGTPIKYYLDGDNFCDNTQYTLPNCQPVTARCIPAPFGTGFAKFKPFDVTSLENY